jgi:hypothetical protein
MNWLSRKVEPEALPANMTLEELLADMERFGKPRLGKYNTGWHSNIEVAVTAVGAQFEIKSEYGMPTPLVAAQQCHERLMQAIRSLGK